MNKMVRYTFEESGPALEKVAIKGKKQMNAEAIHLPQQEFMKFQQAALPLWEEWGKKSPYCSQLLKIAREVDFLFLVEVYSIINHLVAVLFGYPIYPSDSLEGGYLGWT